ncbi:MAG: ArsR family transcriptional regulator, nickel/cobalt-responsive transcriptional repressor [Gaiellales bacterium]|nr:ArsR family transcriptional regulator, nickel/cobalt-responsive transcriptional repressor [Gaiellaceae bacterium]MDX6568387.1 ArsR family transcriptional regulator, nickel/cobalt-responsive transcriptional repressor [Gaiellales bacterium]
MTHGAHGRVSLRQVDSAVAESVAEAMQALSTPSRVRLLARLCEGPCSVGELATSVGLEQSLVSHQLRLLRHLGLVRRVRDGRRSVYELHDEHVAVLLAEAVHHVDHTRLADAAAVAEELADPAAGHSERTL